MSPSKKQNEAVAEDATIEQVSAAEPAHPAPVPGTEPDPAEAGSTEELREQIEETRGELGDTVEALSHKLDVKGRAKDSIDERRQQAAEGVQHAKETVASSAGDAGRAVEEHKVPVATIAAVAGVLVVVIVWRRRSR